MKLPCEDPLVLRNGSYKIDLFNRQPIFKVKKENKNLYVRDWNQAFALLNGKVNFGDINYKYIAAYITGQCDSCISPYKKIERIPRGNNLIIRNGDFFLRKDKLFKISKDTKKMSLEDLKFNLKNKFFLDLKSNLNSLEGNIGCEHSSGLDSNAILGVLTKKIKINRDKLFTYSVNDDVNDGEEGFLIRQFRDFYKLNKENCFGLIELRKIYDENRSEFIGKQFLKVFGAPPLRGENLFQTQLFSEQGVKILFSGLGGDQGLSHHGRNAQSDLILNFNFREFFDWHNDKSYFCKAKLLSTRLIKLTFSQQINILRRNKIRKNILNNILIRNLTEYGIIKIRKYINIEIPYEYDSYSLMKNSIYNRISQEWICVRAEDETRFSKSYGIKKIFPFLDEKLIGILIKQNPIYFNKKGSERFLIRELFKDVYPSYLYSNPSKKRDVSEKHMNELRNYLLDAIVNKLDNLKGESEFISKFWDLKQIIIEINQLLENNNTSLYRLDESYKAICRLNFLNLWFQELTG